MCEKYLKLQRDNARRYKTKRQKRLEREKRERFCCALTLAGMIVLVIAAMIKAVI